MHEAHNSYDFIHHSLTQHAFGGIQLIFLYLILSPIPPSMPLLTLRSAFKLTTSALQVLLPGSCALCHDEIQNETRRENQSAIEDETSGAIQNPLRGALCNACRSYFFAPLARRCRACALRLSDSHANLCGTCLQSPPAFDATIVACDYAAPADMLVKDLKFRARLPLADIFAQQLAQAMATQLSTRPGLMVPVPLSEARLTERGFNQAAEIARSLARHTGIPLQLHLCARIRDTRPQAGLPVSERRVNMRGAFTTLLNASALAELRGRHVLLVDDVMTTGHTLNELAACLKRQGAVRVTNVVFARTPHN
jgi:ComF family protein